MIARCCRAAAAPIVGKWLHVKQQILCPCCSSVIDLTSSRGVENFKGRSGCWRSGQEHNQLVMHPLCLLPLLLLLLLLQERGLDGVGVRGKALRSLKYIQSINKMQTLWKEREGKELGALMHPSQTHRLLTALFLSLLSCLSSYVLIIYGIVVPFFFFNPFSWSVLGLYSLLCELL